MKRPTNWSISFLFSIGLLCFRLIVMRLSRFWAKWKMIICFSISNSQFSGLLQRPPQRYSNCELPISFLIQHDIFFRLIAMNICSFKLISKLVFCQSVRYIFKFFTKGSAENANMKSLI